MSINKIKELFDTWKLSHTVFAAKTCGLKKSTFTNKLKSRAGCIMTANDMECLKKSLLHLSKEIDLAVKDIPDLQNKIAAPVVSVSNDEILAKIAAVKAEKIPKERDTVRGKKVWEQDQSIIIKKLESQLK